MSKLNLNRILGVGLESEENVIPAAGEGAVADPMDAMTEEDMVAQEEEELAAEEIPAVDAEIDSATQDVERLAETAEGLESLAQDLEASLENGGMNQDAAKYLRHSMEAYMKPLGEETGLDASLESFGAFSTRLNASLESLEKVKETIIKIWEAIKSFVKGIWEKVTGFLKSIFTAAGRLKRNAEKLKTAAADYKDSAAGQISTGGKGKRVAIGGKVEIANLDKLIQVAEDSVNFDSKAEALLVKDFEGIKKLAETPIEDDDARLAALLTQQLSQGEKVAPAAFRNRMDDGKELRWATDVLPGNVRFVLKYDNPEQHAGENGSKVKEVLTKIFRSWRIEKEDMQKEGVEVQEIKVFSKAEVIKVATAALRICDIAEKASKQAGYDKLTFKDIKPADGLSKSQAAAVKALMRDYSKRLAMARQLTAKVSAYAVSTAGAFVDLGFRSLKAAGKGQKTPVEDKK